MAGEGRVWNQAPGCGDNDQHELSQPDDEPDELPARRVSREAPNEEGDLPLEATGEDRALPQPAGVSSSPNPRGAPSRGLSQKLAITLVLARLPGGPSKD